MAPSTFQWTNPLATVDRDLARTSEVVRNVSREIFEFSGHMPSECATRRLKLEWRQKASMNYTQPLLVVFLAIATIGLLLTPRSRGKRFAIAGLAGIFLNLLAARRLVVFTTNGGAIPGTAVRADFETTGDRGVGGGGEISSIRTALSTGGKQHI